MSSWFIRTHEVDSNSTTIYRILRTRTVAFLGGGGFKGPETACQTGNIIRWLYNCNTFRKEKKGVILKAPINRLLSMVRYNCTQRFRLSLYLNLLHEWIVLNCSTYDRLYKQILISTEYFRFHGDGDSLQHLELKQLFLENQPLNSHSNH